MKNLFHPTPLHANDCKLELTNVESMVVAKKKKIAAKGDTKANNVKPLAETNWY